MVVLGAVAVGLFPWTLYLTFTLPARHLTPHWDVAWAGFDITEAIFALATAIALLRNSVRVGVLASITGTFLVCDAWFDIVTSQAGNELTSSVVEAVIAELPLAAFCFWLALDAERICARTQGYLAARRDRRSLRDAA